MNEILFPKYDNHEGSEYRAGDIRNLIIVVRADPIICGHSTEARNLAEAALNLGLENVHIVSYPLETLQNSSLPLKPLETIAPYSEGISMDRPEPIGGYKVLDGSLSLGIGGHVVDLLHRYPGRTMVMDLYLVPHGQMVMNAINSFSGTGRHPDVLTVGEAVGSDITNVISNAVQAGQFGAAQIVLSNYLDHDLPVAVSHFTKDMILDSARQVDHAIGTNYTSRLEREVGISYPAVDTAHYVRIEQDQQAIHETLSARGLERDGFIMFLSRIVEAKGVGDLIVAYRNSELHGKKPLIICGNGPKRDEMIAMAGGDPHIHFHADVSDDEKGILMHASYAYALPSKPNPEFTETFGIAVAEKMLAGGPGPVITTRTGGIPEATGGHCLEHRAGDIGELVARLNDLDRMSEDERWALSHRARKFALQFDRIQVLRRLLGRADVELAA